MHKEMSIHETTLSKRTKTILSNNGIRTLGELLAAFDNDSIGILRGIGPKRLEEIIRYLEAPEVIVTDSTNFERGTADTGFARAKKEGAKPKAHEDEASQTPSSGGSPSARGFKEPSALAKPKFSRDEIDSLDQFEQWLRWSLSQVELIGELSITEREYRRLGELLASKLAEISRAHFRLFITHYYPASFVTFLVGHGIFRYSGGTYWPGVIEMLRVKAQWSTFLGQLFLEVLDQLGLETFDEMGGLAYVSPILAHGGIPDYCLSDYYGKVLRRALTHRDYIDLSPEEIIDAVLDDDNAFIFVDKPVQRFLEFGGKVAEDFFSRSLEFVGSYLETGELPNASEFGLPERIGSTFSEWVERNIDEVDEETPFSRSGERVRIKKPDISIDPWGDGVILNLPSQEIPAAISDKTFRWTVRSDANDEIWVNIPLRARKIGLDHRIEGRQIPVDRFVERLNVQFHIDDEVRRSWRIPVLDHDPPLMICRASDGRLIKWKYVIPADTIWIFHPAEANIAFSGEPLLRSKLPQLFGAWRSYSGSEWDLTRVSELIYSPAGKGTSRNPVRPTAIRRQPRLVSNSILEFNNDPDGAPFYMGRPPILHLPLSGRQSAEEQARRWRIALDSKWAALPEIHWQGKLDDLEGAVAIGDDHFELDLAHSMLLGQEAWGTYRLAIRGPLGSDTEFKFRIWPSIEIGGLDSVYMPTHLDDQVIDFTLVGGSEIGVITQSGVQGVEIKANDKSPGAYTISSDPRLDEVPLMLVKDRPDGEQIQLPIFIPLPVVKWMFSDANASEADADWNTAPIIRSFDDVLGHREDAAIRVRVPHLSDVEAEIRLKLIDPSNHILQEGLALRLRTGWHTYRLSLREFADTLRNLPTATCKLELEVFESADGTEIGKIHIATLRELRLVEDIRLERDIEGEQVVLRWKDLKTASDREAHITSAWRVWEETHITPIPDDAEGEHPLEELSVRLLNGRYRIEIVARDPWTSLPRDARREVHSPGSSQVDLGNPTARLAELDSLLRHDPSNFDAHLERAALQNDIENYREAAADFEWCARNLLRASLVKLMAFYRHLPPSISMELGHMLHEHMFSPARMKLSIDELSRDPSVSLLFEEYIAASPTPGYLHRETARLMLDLNSHEAQLKAIQALLSCDDPLAVAKVIDLVMDRELSDRDALALLAINESLSISELINRSREPVPRRLLEGLIPFLDDRVPLIRIGAWIKTDAGWGKILRIRNAEDLTDVESFIHGKETPILDVILREGMTDECIEVNLEEREIRLPNFEPRKYWICGKCNAFLTKDKSSLSTWHDRYHHSGMGSTLYPSPSEEITLTITRYSHKRPGQRRIWE